MKSLKVSTRLLLIVASAVLVMLALAAINWSVMSRLASLQDEGVELSTDAGKLADDANLGAQLYRVVADTYINQNFNEVAQRWASINEEVDQSLVLAEKVSNSPERRRATDDARAAIQEIRKLYSTQYLPLSQQDAVLADIREVDDGIDKQIDKWATAYRQLSLDLLKESTGLDETYDGAATAAKYWMAGIISLGGLLIVALSVMVGRSITQQLGLEPGEACAVAQRIAQGDLTHDFEGRHRDPSSLAGALDAMLVTLKSVVTQVRSGAELVASSSSEIAEGNQDLSSRTESQASSLEQTASSMEELGATVRQNADSSNQANQLASNASAVAIKGGEVVSEVVQTMRGIHDSSQRIANIIGVIDSIAFQTNILALNAAVEAARAGEQGRGFAVVASEVRSLAGRSADAAKEIKSLISSSVEQVAQGTALVDQAGSTMQEVVNSIRTVATLMGEISTASVEQSDGVSQVVEAVSNMDQATQQNAALVEEMAAATVSLRTQAQELLSAVSVFNTGGSLALTAS